jgi:hypothetical protein
MTRLNHFDDLYPGRFLKAGHFPEPRTMRIRDVAHEELHGDKGPQVKVVIAFDEEKLSLVACKTNGICIREMFGAHVPEWIGKRVTLFAGEWAGDPCVRVYGSPELERDIDCVIALPRKKPFTMKLRATGEKPSQKAPAPATKRRAEVTAYTARMKSAATDDDLSLIADGIAEDNDLSADETQYLVEMLRKRRGQIEAEAAK